MSNWSSTLSSRRALLPWVDGVRDMILYLRIFVVAVAAPALMRLPLAHVSALIEPPGTIPDPTPDQEERIIQAVLAVLRVGGPLIRRGCLTRGIVLYYFLRRSGSEVSLCFGMGASTERADGFDGHCWLVKGGEPFLEPRDPRLHYTPMYAFPSGPCAEMGA